MITPPSTLRTLTDLNNNFLGVRKAAILLRPEISVPKAAVEAELDLAFEGRTITRSIRRKRSDHLVG